MLRVLRAGDAHHAIYQILDDRGGSDHLVGEVTIICYSLNVLALLFHVFLGFPANLG